MTTTTTNHTELLALIESLGLTYQARFIPTIQQAIFVKSPQLHWRISLAKGRQLFQCDYRQGVAHVANYGKAHEKPTDRRAAEICYRKTCDNGMLYTYRSWGIQSLMKKQPAPKLIDVLYGLTLDASVLEHSCFETWASDYGYDEDSRESEKIYQVCLKQSLALRALIGNDTLEALQKAYQEY